MTVRDILALKAAAHREMCRHLSDGSSAYHAAAAWWWAAEILASRVGDVKRHFGDGAQSLAHHLSMAGGGR